MASDRRRLLSFIHWHCLNPGKDVHLAYQNLNASGIQCDGICLRFQRDGTQGGYNEPCPFLPMLFCLIFSRTGMHECRLTGGEKQVLLGCFICRQKSVIFFFFLAWTLVGETKATSAELPKRWQTKNYWKCCESALDVPSNIALIFSYFFESVEGKAEFPHNSTPDTAKR